MKKINLVFGLHNHQPVGNFDGVFADAFEKSYEPFLKVLERHPRIRVTIHNTGILFDWLVKNRPAYVELLRELVQRGQVEMMTGGFYEPIISVIPDKDKVGQIRKLTDFVAEHTGYEAKGMWLAERVWEPQLVSAMVEAGVKYTVLDDSHFRSTGIDERDTHGYFHTEDQGRVLGAFPISEALRYTIPFKEPHESIDYLRSVATEDGMATVVMADDGEKFGVWPDTYRHCYEGRWLERFFEALEENSDWINVTTFSDVMEKTPPLGRTYLPTASYFEMMEWAMPPQAILQYENLVHELQAENRYDQNKTFVRAGFWRNFFTKYDESNQIHKRMIRVSQRLSRLADKCSPKQLSEAQDALWSSQCNCAYWHGVFGGLYLGHLRDALYKSMIQADKILDAVEFGKGPFVSAKAEDFLADMRDEIVVESDRHTLIVKPDQGGQIIEHDWKPRAFNLTNTLTRRFEAYHKKVAQAAAPGDDMSANEGKSIHDIVLAKERDLDKYLTYDWYRRSSLVDHFLGDDADVDNFRQARHAEDGDFVNQPYEAKIEKDGKSRTVVLTRDGKVYSAGGEFEVRVEKRLTVAPGEDDIQIDYRVTNKTSLPLKTRFGVEFVSNFLAGDAPDRYHLGIDPAIEDNKLNSTGVQSETTEFGVADEWVDARLAWTIDRTADEVWRAPIETVSLSEAGFERVFQGCAQMPVWKLDLAANETFAASFKMSLTPAKQKAAV